MLGQMHTSPSHSLCNTCFQVIPCLFLHWARIVGRPKKLVGETRHITDKRFSVYLGCLSADRLNRDSISRRQSSPWADSPNEAMRGNGGGNEFSHRRKKKFCGGGAACGRGREGARPHAHRFCGDKRRVWGQVQRSEGGGVHAGRGQGQTTFLMCGRRLHLHPGAYSNCADSSVSSSRRQ